MNETFVRRIPMREFGLWQKLAAAGAPLSFDLELTARCHNDCRHCYINLPAADEAARAKELTPSEIESIASQARRLGAIWCLLTGGEPLLRPDFCEVYTVLRRAGLLVSVFTTACLVRAEHVSLFKEMPPRELEVTVYGATRETYEAVTRRAGSYAAFRRGLDMLLEGGIAVRLKAMALQSNVAELDAILEFCRERTKDIARWDHRLHLRYDRNESRNEEIRRERLTPHQVVALEAEDAAVHAAVEQACSSPTTTESASVAAQLLRCGAGLTSFSVGWNGIFRLCASLQHPDTVFDLRAGSLVQAWTEFAPRVRDLRPQEGGATETCSRCALAALCHWCPAHSYLETGQLDASISSFCASAHARAAAVGFRPGYPGTNGSGALPRV